MSDTFDSQDFYEVCYSYRCTPGERPADVVEAFDRIKAFARRELAEKVSALSETVKWVPVTERLPQAGSEYLTWWAKPGHEPFACVQRFDGDDFLDFGEPDRHITHWMPLPEAPK